MKGGGEGSKESSDRTMACSDTCLVFLSCFRGSSFSFIYYFYFICDSVGAEAAVTYGRRGRFPLLSPSEASQK